MVEVVGETVRYGHSIPPHTQECVVIYKEETRTVSLKVCKAGLPKTPQIEAFRRFLYAHNLILECHFQYAWEAPRPWETRSVSHRVPGKFVIPGYSLGE